MEFLKAGFRDAWYLVIVFVVVMSVAAYKYFNPADTGSAAASALARQGPPAAADDDVGEPEPVVGADSDTRDKQQTEALVQEYEARLKDDPKCEDAPVLLEAMGNLSVQKLVDYQQAAQYYELILVDYPNWPGVARVYPALATCYQRLDDVEGAQWVYKEMMAKLPQDSQEYLYARAQLGIE